MRLAQAKIRQDRFAELNLLRCRDAAAADRPGSRDQRDRNIDHLTGVPYGQVAPAADAGGYILKGEPPELDRGCGSGLRADGSPLLVGYRLAWVVHDCQVLSYPREGEQATRSRRGAYDHDVEAFASAATIGAQDRCQRGGVQEGHAAEVEDDPPGRLTPEIGEGGLHMPDAGALKVASDAEVEQSVLLKSTEAERVRFAQGTCSLAPLSREARRGLSGKLERALGALSELQPSPLRCRSEARGFAVCRIVATTTLDAREESARTRSIRPLRGSTRAELTVARWSCLAQRSLAVEVIPLPLSARAALSGLRGASPALRH